MPPSAISMRVVHALVDQPLVGTVQEAVAVLETVRSLPTQTSTVCLANLPFSLMVALLSYLVQVPPMPGNLFV